MSTEQKPPSILSSPSAVPGDILTRPSPFHAPPPDLEPLHRAEIMECLADYFSELSPCCLMRVMLDTMPHYDDVPPEKKRQHVEAYRVSIRVFEFLCRLERSYLNYRHHHHMNLKTKTEK